LYNTSIAHGCCKEYKTLVGIGFQKFWLAKPAENLKKDLP
jgi:hypothetical protein